MLRVDRAMAIFSSATGFVTPSVVVEGSSSSCILIMMSVLSLELEVFIIIKGDKLNSCGRKMVEEVNQREPSVVTVTSLIHLHRLRLSSTECSPESCQ